MIRSSLGARIACMFLAPVVPLPVAIAASAPQVVLKDISFKPETLAVSKGTTVTWKWDDGDVPHNVTSRGKARFKSSSTKAKAPTRCASRRRARTTTSARCTSG